MASDREFSPRTTGDSGARWLHALADALEQGVLACDADDRVLHANPAFLRLVGARAEDVIGRRPTELRGLSGWGDLAARLDEVRRTRSAATLTGPLEVAAGTRRCRLQIEPGAPDTDDLLLLLTDLGHSELPDERQAVLDSALDRLREMVLLIDEDGRVLFANESLCRTVGYSRAEVLNMTLFDLSPGLRPSFWRAHWAHLSRVGSEVLLGDQRRRDGRDVPIEVRVTRIVHRGREYNLALLTDRTEQQRTETLEHRLSEFLTLAENLPDNIARYGPDGRTTYVNVQLERTLGLPREKLLGTLPTELQPPDVRLYDGYQAAVFRTLATGEPQTVDLDFHTPDGLPQHHQIRMIAERDAEGRVAGVIALGRDLTERQLHLRQIEQAQQEAQQHLRELAVARDAALEAARVKSEFLANMSHEIRTPMNGVLGLADLLLESELPPGSRELAEGIHRSGIALLTVINDILDFSRLEAGRMTVSEEPFDLLTLCNDVIGLLGARAQQRGLVVRHELEERMPLRWLGDPGRIRQVLINLLGNALKFTPSGEVVFRAWAVQGEPMRLVLAVSDTGIGIPADRLDAVFESFTQADGSITRRFGGTGLGLAITKQLVERMGGTIRVTSEVNRGTTFTCELPLRVADSDPCEPPASAPASAIELPALGLSVLLVEDNPVNRTVAVRLLERWDCRVAVAEDGQQGLERMRQEAYDVVLLDVQMPVLDGLTAAREWRGLEARRGGHVPLIALTAHAMEGDRDRCMAAGMDDYVSKPLRPGQLHAAILRAHALRRDPGDATTRAA